ncbi:MAG TPA: extracellular solute-binding protein [Tepidisphaeraceae bacterium]|jgi:multiple sugar transport system substrate-binding protein
MRLFFAVLFLILIVASVFAWRLEPAAVRNGKTVLTWTTDDNPNRRAQIAPFEKAYPSDVVNLDPNNAEVEKVIVQSLAGVGPDIFDCYSPYQLTSYVRAGVAWDVTDELEKHGVDVRKLTWPAVWPDCIYEGRVYGFPANAAVDGIWFNKAFFDQAGIPYPRGSWTWDQFVTLAQKLVRHDASGKVTRYGMLLDWHMTWPQFVLQWGGHLYTPDGTGCTIDSPEAIAGIQFMQDMVYKYHIAPDAIEEAAMSGGGGWGSSGTGVITLFEGRRSAMALGGRYWLCAMRTLPELRVGATECPYHDVPIFRGYGKATLINRNSPHRLEALHWLEYEATPEYSELINEQADGVGPVMKYTETKKFLNNPKYPDETYNAVWAKMQKLAVGDTPSPYVNGETADRLIWNQLDLIKANLKSVPDAMHDAAQQINAEIQETISESPELRKRYDQAVGK